MLSRKPLAEANWEELSALGGNCHVVELGFGLQSMEATFDELKLVVEAKTRLS